MDITPDDYLTIANAFDPETRDVEALRAALAVVARWLGGLDDESAQEAIGAHPCPFDVAYIVLSLAPADGTVETARGSSPFRPSFPGSASSPARRLPAHWSITSSALDSSRRRPCPTIRPRPRDGGRTGLLPVRLRRANDDRVAGRRDARLGSKASRGNTSAATTIGRPRQGRGSPLLAASGRGHPANGDSSARAGPDARRRDLRPPQIGARLRRPVSKT